MQTLLLSRGKSFDNCRQSRIGMSVKLLMKYRIGAGVMRVLYQISGRGACAAKVTFAIIPT